MPRDAHRVRSAAREPTIKVPAKVSICTRALGAACRANDIDGVADAVRCPRPGSLQHSPRCGQSTWTEMLVRVLGEIDDAYGALEALKRAEWAETNSWDSLLTALYEAEGTFDRVRDMCHRAAAMILRAARHGCIDYVRIVNMLLGGRRYSALVLRAVMTHWFRHRSSCRDGAQALPRMLWELSVPAQPVAAAAAAATTEEEEEEEEEDGAIARWYAQSTLLSILRDSSVPVADGGGGACVSLFERVMRTGCDALVRAFVARMQDFGAQADAEGLLAAACRAGSVAAVDALIVRGALAGLATRRARNSLLEIAAEGLHAGVVRRLLDDAPADDGDDAHRAGLAARLAGSGGDYVSTLAALMARPADPPAGPAAVAPGPAVAVARAIAAAGPPPQAGNHLYALMSATGDHHWETVDLWESFGGETVLFFLDRVLDDALSHGGRPSFGASRLLWAPPVRRVLREHGAEIFVGFCRGSYTECEKLRWLLGSADVGRDIARRDADIFSAAVWDEVFRPRIHEWHQPDRVRMLLADGRIDATAGGGRALRLAAATGSYESVCLLLAAAPVGFTAQAFRDAVRAAEENDQGDTAALLRASDPGPHFLDIEDDDDDDDDDDMQEGEPPAGGRSEGAGHYDDDIDALYNGRGDEMPACLCPCASCVGICMRGRLNRGESQHMDDGGESQHMDDGGESQRQ